MTVRAVKFRGIQEDERLFDIVYAGVYTCKGTASAEVAEIRGVKDTDAVAVVPFGAQTHAMTLAACGKNRVTITCADAPGPHSQKYNLLVARQKRLVSAAKRRKY